VTQEKREKARLQKTIKDMELDAAERQDEL
jgi:hypothetical protein